MPKYKEDKELSETFDYNNLYRASSEGDRETTVQLGVFRGSASFTVFKKREIVAKVQLPRDGQVFLAKMARKLIGAGPGTHQTHQLHKWNADDKKMEPAGTIVLGRNDKNICYLGISVPGFSGAKFPFRLGLAWGSSETPSESEKSEIAFDQFIRVLELDVVIACLNTKFKQDFVRKDGGGSSSGNRSGNANANSTDDDIFG